MPPPTEDAYLKRIEDERLRWGIPNWRNPAEYEYTNHNHSPRLINDQLRWEFLRRNKDYRVTWQDGESYRKIFGLIAPIDPSLRGDQLDNKSILFIDSVFRGSPVNMAAPNPSDEKEFIRSYAEFILQAEQDGFLIIGFDPSQPVRPQINRAELILTKHHKNLLSSNEKISARGSQVKEPSKLLRTLDAVFEETPPLEIASVIYKRSGKYADQKAAARAIVHERVKSAQDYWKKVLPASRNVLM